jgi:tripartite-type tricarboxylate transporter receptor subunit TctC
MKLPRRKFLHLAAGAAALPAMSRIARAQAYPTRPVRIIAPTGPAGAPDVVARLMAPWLSERLGQQFVVENRPGSGSNIGTEAVVRASPDGYTLLVVSSANTINASLYDKLNFVFLRDIAAVAGIISLPFVRVVSPSVPAKTVPEFMAYAKANPGKISFGSPGIGTPGHVAGELFKMMAGVEMVHVPYRAGGAVLSDLLGGQVQVLFGTTSLTVEHVMAGKLRPLAVTSARRWEGLPDIPTVDDFV